MILTTIREIEMVLKTAPSRIRRGLPTRIIEKRLDELFHQLILSINQEFEHLDDPRVIKEKLVEYLRALNRLQAKYDESTGIQFWSKLLPVITLLRSKFWRYAFEERDVQRELVEILSYVLVKAELEKELQPRGNLENFQEFTSNYRFLVTVGLEYWILMDEMHLVTPNEHVEWTKKCLKSFDGIIRYINLFLEKMKADPYFLRDIGLDTIKNNFISFLSIYLQVYFIMLALLRRAQNRQVTVPEDIELFHHQTQFTIPEFLDEMDRLTHETANFMAAFISNLEETLSSVYHGLVQQGAFQSPTVLFFQTILSVEQIQINQFRMLHDMFSLIKEPLTVESTCNDKMLFENLQMLAEELEYRVLEDRDLLQDASKLAAKADKVIELILLVENLSCQLLFFPSLVDEKTVVTSIMEYDRLLHQLPLGTFSFQELYVGTLALLAHLLKKKAPLNQQLAEILDYVFKELDHLRKAITVRQLDRISVEILVQLLQAFRTRQHPRLQLDEGLLARLPPSFQTVVLEYLEYCNSTNTRGKRGSEATLSPLLESRTRHFCIADPLTWIKIAFPFESEENENGPILVEYLPFNYYVDRNLGLMP